MIDCQSKDVFLDIEEAIGGVLYYFPDSEKRREVILGLSDVRSKVKDGLIREASDSMKIVVEKFDAMLMEGNQS